MATEDVDRSGSSFDFPTMRYTLRNKVLFSRPDENPQYTDLRHSKWLLEMKKETEPMFLSWFNLSEAHLLWAARPEILLERLAV